MVVSRGGKRGGREMLGPGAVFADRAGIAIGQVVQQRPGVTGKPVRLADPPSVLAGREDLLAELDIRLTGGDRSEPPARALFCLGGAGEATGGPGDPPPRPA